MTEGETIQEQEVVLCFFISRVFHQKKIFFFSEAQWMD